MVFDVSEGLVVVLSHCWFVHGSALLGLYPVLFTSLLVCTQFCVRLCWFVPSSVYVSVGLYPVLCTSLLVCTYPLLCTTLLVCTQFCVRLWWFVPSSVYDSGGLSHVSICLDLALRLRWFYVSIFTNRHRAFAP